MKKLKNKQHQKQKLRARRRRDRRHIKRILAASTLIYNLSGFTKSLSKIGYAMQDWIKAMSTDIKPLMDKWNQAYQEWEKKKLEVAQIHKADLHMWAYGGPMTTHSSNVGPNLVRRHKPEFTQEVIHPDPTDSNIFGSTFHQNNQISAPLNEIIMDLNDNCGWTREQIADWLDTLDNQPIFYPNTCPDDCQKECCKPPSQSFLIDKIKAGTISAAPIQYTPSIEYAISDADHSLANYYQQSTAYMDKIESLYKGSITIPDKWLQKQSAKDIHQLEKLLNEWFISKDVDFTTNSTVITTTEGSNAEVKATLHAVQQFMKGNINELPAQPCNCYCEHPTTIGPWHNHGCPKFATEQH